MDGNGRWAKKWKKPRVFGHRSGLRAARALVAACVELQIPTVTLFAFSSENWQRPPSEIEQLMRLFKRSFKRDLKAFHDQHIQLKFIGDLTRFDRSLQQSVSEIEQLTHENPGLKLRIAVNYGGRWDILQAVHKTLAVGGNFNSFLSLSDVPEPDLFIRTGGEKRLSNFLLWQLAYTELFFSDTLWPDFTPEEFKQILLDFSKRERRFGSCSV